MKKTILTIMVAAMMLVAFTACEQQGYKIPIGLELTNSKAAYLVGEPFDYSAVSGVVTFSDNSTKNVTGNDLATGSSVTTDVAGAKAVTFTYGGYQGASATITFDVLEPVGVKLTTLPTTGAIGATKFEDVPAIVTLSDGSTMNLNVDVAVTALSGTVGQSAKVSVATSGAVVLYDTSIDGVDVKGTDDWSVTLTADADKFNASDVRSLVVEYKNTTTPAAGYNDPYINDVISATIYAVDGNNNKSLALSSGAGGYSVTDGGTFSGSHRTTATAPAKVTLVYTDNPTIKVEVEFKAGRSYISAVSLKAVAEQPTLAAGTTMTPSLLRNYYTFETTYVGSDGVDFVPSDSNCVIMNPTVGESGTYTPTVKLLYGKTGTTTWTDGTTDKGLAITPASV